MIQLNKSKYLLISKYIFQKNFLNRNFNRKVRYREGVLIDFFIIVQGTLSISIRHTGLQFNDDEEKDDENDGAPTKAVVQFIAQMVLKESGEVTAFMETANLERFQAEGAPWLYVNGTIEAAPEDYARENNIQLHEHAEEAAQDEEETSSAASSEEQKGEGAVVAEPEDSNLTDNHSQ